MPLSVIQQYTKSSWDIYKDSETVDEVFYGILKSLSEISKAEFSFLYLEEDSIVSDISSPNADNKEPLPVISQEFILSSIHSPKEDIVPRNRISTSHIKFTKQVKVSNSIYYQSGSATTFSIKGLNDPKNYQILTFDSPKVNLCRALFVIGINSSINPLIDFELIRLSTGVFLDSIIPIIESVYRRQIDRLSRKIISSYEGLFTGKPGYYFQNTFKEICETLKVEGASLIVKGLPSSNSTLQLVSSYPKVVPKDRNVYPNDCCSPTQWIFSYAEPCSILSIGDLRKKLIDNYYSQMKECPIWCDTLEINNERSILYTFYKSQEDIQYLFRCTNSLKNPSLNFHTLDRKICTELAVSFGLMHKSIENEFRAMRIFFDVKHEFRQKLIGVNSATNYVSKSLLRKMDNDVIANERILKLKHIKDTVLDIVKMLNRFNFPLPTLDDKEQTVQSFRPYGDLVKPICETFLDKAMQNGKFFRYHGYNQLGLIYSSLADWKQVVENIVNNMVKYTYDNEEMAVAFERISGGGGIIHFASKSVSINPDEIEMLFEFRYRSKSATEKTDDGDGIGLSIAKYLVSGYGGQILCRISDDINIFSLSLPKHLFRPPHNELVKRK